MGDETGIGGARGPGQRLQDVVELALRPQRVLALGFERMLEHARGKQLHLVEAGSLIGVFVRDHLALLGDAEAAADRAGGLRRDGAPRRRAAAGDRAAAAMKEGDRYARIGADLGQLRLGLRQFPVRGDEAAILVGIGIADHHFLHAALPMGAAADERHGERLAHDRGRGAEIADGLEQRHDGKGADFGAGRIEKRPALFGEDIGAEDIVDRARHRQDEGADGVAVEHVPRRSRLREHVDQFGRFGREFGNEVRAGQRPGERPVEPGAPFAAADFGRAVVAVTRRRPPQSLERRAGLGGIFAQVEAHGGEAEDLHGAPDRAHQIGGERRTVRLFERALDDAEIEDQLVGAFISRAGTADILPLDAGEPRVELPQNDRKELTIRFAGVARLDPLLLAARRKRLRELGAEGRRYGERPLGNGERPGEVENPLAIMPERGKRVLAQGPIGNARSHGRIAVAVAADPRSELEKRRQLELDARIVLVERQIDQAQQLRRLLEDRLVEEMQTAGDFVLHRRLLQMQLSRHPHELDLIAEAVDQRGPLALGPARQLELAEQAINPAVLFQHGDAFRLGRVGGDDRPDAQAREKRLDFLRRDAVARGLGEHVVEGAAQRLASAGPLDVAAPAHGGVLLGDGEKLEPDALRLERARHQLGGEARDIGAANKEGLDLGLMPAHHLDEEPEQEIGCAFGRCAADDSLRRLDPTGRRLQLLIHGDARYSRPRRSAGYGVGPARGHRSHCFP